ncbi:uncharacterized protein M6B38_389010 [Iris pallida]|uniref:RING-CH-type domain-containing protein n=1 Tax=Iris pallida TaxID=29817 RepID=A0AAX6G1P9_IRIPA|nr:uncharacterized protein M6B38_232590 [Iris pallida]KAJ6822363.1 uncharacterized protein M6B38_389010 [Iris pallida]
MGEHFVLLVDRLITESTLEAAIESRKQAKLGSSVGPKVDSSPWNSSTATGKLVECRICQDEDEDSNMEVPCSCSGSLKYAHRKCVQRWCNEKGDTVCEICLQQFKPNYTSPPKLFRYGRIPMNFRGNWEISRRDIHNQQFMTMVQTNRDFVGSSSYDDYASSSTRSIMYCRFVAVIFMILLILRHALPMLMSGAEQYSLALFILLLLRTAGIVLPLYVMLRAVTTFHRRRLQQDAQELPTPTSEGENVDVQP